MRPPRSGNPSLRRAAALALLGLCAAMAGCADDYEYINSGPPTSTSVLDLFAPPTPVEAVAWATDPYDPGKRQRGILLLASAPWGGERAYLEMYTYAARDGDSSVRAAALRALALHGTVEQGPLIVESMSDEADIVRREAARALQRIHTDKAPPVLVRALDERTEPDGDVRAFSACALGQYPTPAVVQSLISALNDRRLAVNEAACGSLHTLTGQDFHYDTAEWLEWTEAAGPNLFAQGKPYEYPIFKRDPTLVERIVPWLSPPNEVQGRPVGMPPPETVAGAQKPEHPDAEGG